MGRPCRFFVPTSLQHPNLQQQPPGCKHSWIEVQPAHLPSVHGLRAQAQPRQVGAVGSDARLPRQLKRRQHLQVGLTQNQQALVWAGCPPTRSPQTCRLAGKRAPAHLAAALLPRCCCGLRVEGDVAGRQVDELPQLLGAHHL